MESGTAAVKNYFARLGLGPEVADMYVALHTYGPQTISQLARRSGVERTRIYRLMDEIGRIGLFEIETRDSRSVLKAAPITNVQLLLTKKEEDLKAMRTQLKGIRELLGSTGISSPLTRVQFYSGADGVRRMFWNQTRPNTENLAILYENMQNRTNGTFFERWVEQCNKRGVAFRGIISDNFIQTQQEWYAGHANERLANWSARYVSPAAFPITHSSVVYDNVVAYFNWKGGEIFGIEIYNQQIADTQRQFFEIIWASAQPVDDLKGNIGH
jgi:hypothetical protein